MTHRERDKPRISEKARALIYDLGIIAKVYWERLERNLATTRHPDQTPKPRRARRDRVPRIGEYVLYLLLPRRDRDPIIGDLREIYFETIEPKFGRAAAWWWYWTQVARCLSALTPVRLVKWAALAAGLLRWRS
jgi:hypothetical protein